MLSDLRMTELPLFPRTTVTLWEAITSPSSGLHSTVAKIPLPPRVAEYLDSSHR